MEKLTDEEKEIVKSHPSICYNCGNARSVVKKENELNGFVGCTLLTDNPSEVLNNMDKIIAEGVMTGYVYLRKQPFCKNCNHTMNNTKTKDQLMVKEASKCKYYYEEKFKINQ
jgi:predicted Zn-ribbon and HTH transcriptional regulator